jgi:hypothetical protein
MDKKRRRDRKVPGHYKVQGTRVEDRDVGALSRQALGRDRARFDRRDARKKAKSPRPASVQAPKARGEAPAAAPPTARGREQQNREFARMNERVNQRRVRMIEEPRYLTDVVRGMMQRVARVVLSPFALARAVVKRLRDRD